MLTKATASSRMIRSGDWMVKTRRKPVPSKLQECLVCSEERGDNEYPTVGHFQAHKICLICLRKYLETKVLTDGATDVRCPDTTCKAWLPYNEIKIYSGARAFVRFDELLNKKTYEIDPNFRWCSNSDCGAGHIIDDGDLISFFTCIKCKSKTCFSCSIPWHSGYTCVQYKAGQEEQKHSESRSNAWLSANAKLCRCGKWVQKIDGCDHMTCVCGAEWCYVCGVGYEEIRRRGDRAHKLSCTYYPL